MLEKRVFHPGLKTFRVVRGTDPTTVDFLAKWQMEAWEERWRKIQTAAEKRSRDEQAASQSSGKKNEGPEFGTPSEVHVKQSDSYKG